MASGFSREIGDHKGHRATSMDDKAKEMIGSIKDHKQQLEKRKKEASSFVTETEKERDNIQRDFDEAMKTDALKKEYDADMAKVGKKLDEAKKNVEDVELVQKDVEKLDSSYSLANILKLQKDVVRVLGEKFSAALPAGPDIRGLRAAVQKVLPDKPWNNRWDDGDVAVPMKFFRDWRSFADGLTDSPPAPLNWPSPAVPLKWRDNESADQVAIIARHDAAQLLQLTGGGQRLELGTEGIVNCYHALMGAGGEVVYVDINVLEVCGSEEEVLGKWLCPATTGLEEAMTQVTGSRPRRLTDLFGKTEFSLAQSCGQWRTEFDQYHLIVHY